jgi:hypothetical protein
LLRHIRKFHFVWVFSILWRSLRTYNRSVGIVTVLQAGPDQGVRVVFAAGIRCLPIIQSILTDWHALTHLLSVLSMGNIHSPAQ